METIIAPAFEDPGIEVVPPECISYEEILDGLSEEHRELLTKHFETAYEKGEKALRKYKKAKFPVPRLIYTNKFCMKTLNTSAFPDPLKTRDELFICDLCLGGFLSQKQFELHVVSFFSYNYCGSNFWKHTFFGRFQNKRHKVTKIQRLALSKIAQLRVRPPCTRLVQGSAPIR